MRLIQIYWKLLKNNRVLVVFDEIHHCAGSSIEDANVWGQDIVKNIQDQASFTLASPVRYFSVSIAILPTFGWYFNPSG